MVNLKRWMAKVSETLAGQYNGFHKYVLQQSVVKNTDALVGEFVLPKGYWLVVSTMGLSAAGTSFYNHNVDGVLTRGTEYGGGGNVNVRIYNIDSSRTIQVRTYLRTVDATVTAIVDVIKLGG